MRSTFAVALALFGLAWACSPLKTPHPERWEPGYGATDYAITETVARNRSDAGKAFAGDAGLGERQ